MKLISGIVLTLCLFSTANAQVLICDVDTNCEYYKVYADDVLIADNVPAPLNYDLSGMTPGIINFDAECCNYWGCERTVNPYVSKDASSAPQNLEVRP